MCNGNLQSQFVVTGVFDFSDDKTMIVGSIATDQQRPEEWKLQS